MGFFVRIQAFVRRECATTKRTNALLRRFGSGIGAFSVLRPNVISQVFGPREAPRTILTFMRLDVVVGLLVHLQMVGTTEALAAFCASEWTLIRVYHHVALEMRCSREFFRTFIACVPPPRRMRCVVHRFGGNSMRSAERQLIIVDTFSRKFFHHFSIDQIAAVEQLFALHIYRIHIGAIRLQWAPMHGTSTPFYHVAIDEFQQLIHRIFATFPKNVRINQCDLTLRAKELWHSSAANFALNE